MTCHNKYIKLVLFVGGKHTMVSEFCDGNGSLCPLKLCNNNT